MWSCSEKMTTQKQYRDKYVEAALEGKKLNLGAGEDYREGWINVDNRGNVKKDTAWDINKFPYPFKDDTFNYALLSMVLEHVEEPIKVLKEIIRVCKHDAVIKVIVPHANSYANNSDLQHKARFTEHTFNLFHLTEYEIYEIRQMSCKFTYDKKYKRFVPFKWFFKIYLNGIYDNIEFEFLVVKKAPVEVAYE